MTSPAKNQSIMTTCVTDVLEAGVPAVVQNIRAAQRRVTCDDLTNRFFDNAIESAEMLLAQAVDVYNNEADEHNSLVETLEDLQEQLHGKNTELTELQILLKQHERQKQDEVEEAVQDAMQRADRAELLCVEMETKLNEVTAMVELRNQQIQTLHKSYKEVMALDPLNLEKRYAKAKRERQDLRKQVSDLNQKIVKLTKDLSDARVAYARQKTETTRLVEETTKYATLQKEMYGITQRQFTSTKEHPTLGPIHFYPRLLAYGISSPKQFNNERPYIVTKLDFAYQFCCDMGFAIDNTPVEYRIASMLNNCTAQISSLVNTIFTIRNNYRKENREAEKHAQTMGQTGIVQLAYQRRRELGWNAQETAEFIESQGGKVPPLLMEKIRAELRNPKPETPDPAEQTASRVFCTNRYLVL